MSGNIFFPILCSFLIFSFSFLLYAISPLSFGNYYVAILTVCCRRHVSPVPKVCNASYINVSCLAVYALPLRAKLKCVPWAGIAFFSLYYFNGSPRQNLTQVVHQFVKSLKHLRLVSLPEQLRNLI